MSKTLAKLSSTPLEAWMRDCIQRVNHGLTHYLNEIPHPAPKLQEAMAYALMNGGKRVRPLLVYATGQIFEAPLENLDLAAIAVELIHSYSLIHDDLPAMDNADWRRGKLSCHKVYGEDLAILAGDALQALAFEVLASYPATLPAESRLEMVQILSKASGPLGMVGGQTLDILNIAQTQLVEKDLIQLYQLKTGALLQASIHLGALAASLEDPEHEAALGAYAKNISLAFQIQDDILDIEGQSEQTGKPTGLDLGKLTYPALLGLDQAKQKLSTLTQEAFQALIPYGEKADRLRKLTEYLAKRDR